MRAYVVGPVEWTPAAVFVLRGAGSPDHASAARVEGLLPCCCLLWQPMGGETAAGRVHSERGVAAAAL